MSTTLLTKAINVAVAAHEGVTDKLGNPYIAHIFRVMGRLTSPDLMVVAALHDLIEDTPVTYDDLRREGFPEPIITAVDSLTRRKGEPYDEYVYRASQNPIGLRVKIADLMDNSDPKRLAYLGEKDRQRLESKYRNALEFLLGVLMREG